MHRRSFWLGMVLAVAALPGHAANAPALLLANGYRPGLSLADYWVSEKYDGVRGYWDGRALRTRGPGVGASAWRNRPRASSRPATPHGGRCASWCLTCRNTAARSMHELPR